MKRPGEAVRIRTASPGWCFGLPPSEASIYKRRGHPDPKTKVAAYAQNRVYLILFSGLKPIVGFC